MCQKTKLLTERVCHPCGHDRHLLYFRFIEHGTVYYFAKCMKCNYSFRANCTLEKWKLYQEENIILQQLTKHHRIPRSQPNSTENPSNISMVPLKKHQAYHCLFGTKTPQQIADYLNNVWIDPSKKLIVVNS